MLKEDTFAAVVTGETKVPQQQQCLAVVATTSEYRLATLLHHPVINKQQQEILWCGECEYSSRATTSPCTKDVLFDGGRGRRHAFAGGKTRTRCTPTRARKGNRVRCGIRWRQ